MVLMVSILVVAVVICAIFTAVVFYGDRGGDDSEEEPNEDVVISEDVCLPEENPSIVDVQVRPDSVTYVYDDIPEELNYSVGDIIVGTTDLGYLRRVVSIQEDGDTVNVQTENATLEEVVRKGGFSFETNLTDAGLAEVKSSEDWPVATAASTDYDLFGINVPVNETYYIGDVEINLYGQVNLSITLALEVEFDWFTGLHRVYFAVETWTYFELHFVASSEANFSEEWFVYSHWFPTYVVTVGGIPVVLTPQVEFIINATGGMSSSLTAAVNGTFATTSGIEYSEGSWGLVQESTKELGYETPVLDGSAFLRVNKSTPRVTLWIYGMVGPYFTLRPWAAFEAEGHATLEEIALSWNLDVGLKGVMGVRVEVLSAEIVDYSVDLFGQTWNVASGDILLTAPSPPRNLVGIPGDGHVTLAWEQPLSDGGLPLTEYRIFKGSASGGEEFLTSAGLSLEYLDYAVINENTYYYTVTARNGLWESETSEEAEVTPTAGPLPPSAPLNLAAVLSGASVQLTWEPPLSEGTSPITGYILYRDGSVLAELGVATSYLDENVATGNTYAYRISALNDDGEGPLSGEVSITVDEEPPFYEDFEAYSSVEDSAFETVWTKHELGYPVGEDEALIETRPDGGKVLWESVTNVPYKAFSQVFDARDAYATDFVLEFDMGNITYEGYGSYKVFCSGMDFRASNDTCYRFAFLYSEEMGGSIRETICKLPSGRQWENITYILNATDWRTPSFPESHHVKVVCSGPDISVYMDQGIDPILTATDSSFTGGFIGTYIEAGDGMGGIFTGSRHIDNVSLSPIDDARALSLPSLSSTAVTDETIPLPSDPLSSACSACVNPQVPLFDELVERVDGSAVDTQAAARILTSGIRRGSPVHPSPPQP